MMKTAAILGVAAATMVDCNLPDGAGGYLVYAGQLETQCCAALMQKTAGGIIKLGQGAALPGCLPTMFGLNGGACVDASTNPQFTVVGNRSLAASDYGKYPTDVSWIMGFMVECADSRLCTASYLKAITETYATNGSLHAAMGMMLGDMADTTCPTLSSLPTSPATVVGPLSCEPITGAINFGPQDTKCCEHVSTMVVANALADPAGQAATGRCFAHGPDGCVTEGPLAGKMPNNTEIAAAIAHVCAAPPGACGQAAVKGLRESAGVMNPVVLAGLDKNNDNVTDLCVRTCTRPTTTGYNFSSAVEASLAAIGIMGGSITGVQCAANYVGTPVIAPCPETGTDYVVAGCSIDPVYAYYKDNALCTNFGANDNLDNSAKKVTKAGAEVTCASLKSSTSMVDAQMFGGVCCKATAAPTEVTEKSVCSAVSGWDKASRTSNTAAVSCVGKDGKAVTVGGAFVTMGAGFNSTANAALCTDAATGNSIVTQTCGEVYAAAAKYTATELLYAGAMVAAGIPEACCGGVLTASNSVALSVATAILALMVLA